MKSGAEADVVYLEWRNPAEADSGGIFENNGGESFALGLCKLLRVGERFTPGSGRIVNQNCAHNKGPGPRAAPHFVKAENPARHYFSSLVLISSAESSAAGAASSAGASGRVLTAA